MHPTFNLLSENLKLQDGKVIIYAEGLCYMSVCSSVTREETDRIIAVRPSGTTLGWKICDENFRSGESNPCPCDKYEDRQHYLLEC